MHHDPLSAGSKAAPDAAQTCMCFDGEELCDLRWGLRHREERRMNVLQIQVCTQDRPQSEQAIHTLSSQDTEEEGTETGQEACGHAEVVDFCSVPGLGIVLRILFLAFHTMLD